MKCLRCGKESAASASFCDECLKIVDTPLETSPYLNTQINLGARKAQRRLTPAPEAKKAKDEVGSRTGLIVAVVLLSILCVALACGCAYFAREELLALLGG